MSSTMFIGEISSLLQKCNSLKAKEGALFLFNLDLISSNGRAWHNLKVLDGIIYRFFRLEKFGKIYRSNFSTSYGKNSALNCFIIPFIVKLLLQDPECSGVLFLKSQRACRTIFEQSTEISYETFTRLVPPGISTSSDNFFVSLLVLEHRRLFRRSSKWIPMTITHLTVLPIEKARSTVINLSD